MRFWTTLQLRSVLEMPRVKDFSSSALYTFSFLYNLRNLLKLFSFNKWPYATNTYFNPRTFLRSCLYVVEGTSEPRMTEIRHTALFLAPSLPLLLPVGFLPPSLAEPHLRREVWHCRTFQKSWQQESQGQFKWDHARLARKVTRRER